MTLQAELSEALKALAVNLNLHRVSDGYQANLEISPGKFRICHAPNAHEALLEVLRIRVSDDLPPPPY